MTVAAVWLLLRCGMRAWRSFTRRHGKTLRTSSASHRTRTWTWSASVPWQQTTYWYPGLMAALKRENLDHVGVVVGGIVPHDEEALLITAGVSRVFHPGSPMEEIAREVSQLAANARQQAPELLE